MARMIMPEEVLSVLSGTNRFDLDELSMIKEIMGLMESYPVLPYPWLAVPPEIIPVVTKLARLVAEGTEEPPTVYKPVNIITDLAWHKSPTWPFPSKPRAPDDIHYITVHHSGTTPREQTSITAWNNYHVASKSWSHIGYHFAIGMLHAGAAMELYQCNEITQITWHDSVNYNTIGVVMAGDLRSHRDIAPTPWQAELFGNLMAWLVPQLPGLKGIVPHKHWSATACPGDWDGWLPGLIRACDAKRIDITPYLGLKRSLFSVQSAFFDGYRIVRNIQMGAPMGEDQDEHDRMMPHGSMAGVFDHAGAHGDQQTDVPEV